MSEQVKGLEYHAQLAADKLDVAAWPGDVLPVYDYPAGGGRIQHIDAAKQR